MTPAELVELAQRRENWRRRPALGHAYCNKPTSEGLYQHYLAIANATKLPIVVYNVASRTARNVTPDELITAGVDPQRRRRERGFRLHRPDGADLSADAG
ncbi:MAG: dihydrodipicolinate synthase family protein [Bryobacterales bacterium]